MKTKANILIVDDNVGLSKSLSLILKKKGYVAFTAENGFEAMEMVKESFFDVILMDIKMPLLDGVETNKRIKELSPDSSVIMMTAYAVEDLVKDALNEGAFGIIYKPLDIDETIDMIEKARMKDEGILVLIVDDDEGLRITLRNILKKRSYQVSTAATGEEAIDKVRENGIDVIFIDVKLPTINGLETYLEIKKIDLRVIVVMMTGYRQEVSDLVKEALRENAYTCLYKPLDIEQLLSLISEIIKVKRASK